MAQQIQLRHDTAANWTTANPTLMVGEFGYETDTKKFKVGDGSTAWTSLAYTPLPASLITGTVAIANGGSGQTTQAAAITALTGTQSAGKYLRSDGTNAALATIVAADVPTLNQNTTGTAASFTGSLAGDVTGTQGATTVGKLNGVSLSGLATGILKNTTTTGAPSIAVAADFPTLNQNTTGSAGTATSPATGTAHGAVTLDSSGHFQSVAPSTSGNVLQSNGTDWVSAAAPSPALTIQSKSAAYTVLSTDRLMIGDATSAAFTFTLPTGASGVPLWFKKKDSDTTYNAITITDGTFSTTLNTSGESVCVVYTGSAYEILDRRIPGTTAVDSGFTASAGFGTGGTAPTGVSISRTRLGDRLVITGTFLAGTVAASVAYIQLPSGLTIDYTKLGTGQVRIGDFASGSSSTVTVSGGAFEGPVFTDGSTTNQVFFAQYTTTSGLAKGFGNEVTITGKVFTFTCEIPITGWKG